jgi:hypothetical protein
MPMLQPSEFRVFSGSSRVLQGAAWAPVSGHVLQCKRSAVAGVPRFQSVLQIVCGRNLARCTRCTQMRQMHQTPTSSASPRSKIQHFLVHLDHIASTRASRFAVFPGGKGPRWSHFRSCPSSPPKLACFPRHGIGEMHVSNPEMRPRPLHWLTFPSSAVSVEKLELPT